MKEESKITKPLLKTEKKKYSIIAASIHYYYCPEASRLNGGSCSAC
jgi:uncharacterized protein YlxP (DUF503 family)